VRKLYDSIKSNLNKGDKDQVHFNKFVDFQKQKRLDDMHTKIANAIFAEIKKQEYQHKQGCRSVVRQLSKSFKEMASIITKSHSKLNAMSKLHMGASESLSVEQDIMSN
jgi:hypothetical protein